MKRYKPCGGNALEYFLWFGWKQNKGDREPCNLLNCKIVSFQNTPWWLVLVIWDSEISRLVVWKSWIIEHWAAAPGQQPDISAGRGRAAPPEKRKNRWSGGLESLESPPAPDAKGATQKYQRIYIGHQHWTNCSPDIFNLRFLMSPFFGR